jgi:hypothetical protein
MFISGGGVFSCIFIENHAIFKKKKKKYEIKKGGGPSPSMVLCAVLLANEHGVNLPIIAGYGVIVLLSCIYP